MKLLAFETATEACSVALWIDGMVIERFEIAPRRHAELSLPWAEQLMAEAGIARSQLDGIAVGRGPGAFTGVRLAIALAQGIAMALDKPVVAVSTLAALAMQSAGDCTLAAIDARMGEIYIGAFERIGDAQLATSAETVVRPDAVLVPDGGSWTGVGTGFAAADGALVDRLSDRLSTIDAAALPHAADVARLAAAAFLRGEAVAADRIEPAYLRNDVALTLVQQAANRAAR
jgi:tRNA threonylcarbamoyladenosine biosynthesis protein TsaB